MDFDEVYRDWTIANYLDNPGLRASPAGSWATTA